MIAAPNAISHGLSTAAGAALGAFAGMSAAIAGAAAETASAATTDNTTFFIESAPSNSTGLRVFGRSPSASSLRKAVKVPGVQSTGTRFDVHYGKFRPVTAGRGKPKSTANAAFLGESALYRQKGGTCCVNVTNTAREAVLRAVPAGPGATVFHTLPDVYGRLCSVSELELSSRRFLAVGFEP